MKPWLFEQNRYIEFRIAWDYFCSELMHSNRFTLGTYYDNNDINVNGEKINLYLLFNAVDSMIEYSNYTIDHTNTLHRARLYDEETIENQEINKCFDKVIKYFMKMGNDGEQNEESKKYYKDIITQMESYKNSTIDAMQYYKTLKQINGTLGFDVDEMKAPPKEKAKAGRMNPEGISYLYTSDNIRTCIAEIKPYIGSKVSTIDIIPKEKLKIFNISQEGYINTELEGFKFIDFLEQKFKTPYKPDEAIDYLPTQYITEYIKYKGFDGIRHKSSVSDGYNIIIFNQDKVKFADKTALHFIKWIEYDYDPVIPNISIF